jgi:hypothetical protein
MTIREFTLLYLANQTKEGKKAKQKGKSEVVKWDFQVMARLREHKARMAVLVEFDQIRSAADRKYIN